MGNIIGSICKGERHINDDFIYDNQIILNRMVLYLESEKERKDKKLKIIENKLNKKTLRRLFK